MPVKIFFCYAHKDKKLKEHLENHLVALRHSGQIITWDDREIPPGTDWKKEIDTHLLTSDIILLLVSPNFMRSEYCYGIEMRQALKRHKAGEARVIPVILHPVQWKETPIGDLQALPTDGKPVSTWRNRDRAFLDVERGIAKVVQKLLAEIQSDEELDASQAENHKKKHILVVEDQVPVQHILLRELTNGGYEVLLADNGKQALELLRLHQPDLMLLDLYMPGGLDGLDVCVKAREFSHIPIIVVSAISENRKKVRALNLGADDYLTKPFSGEELLARVHACLRRATTLATPLSS